MKIKDRLMLGFFAGFGGNLVKRSIMFIARQFEWAEFDGPEKAAGLVLPAWKVSTTRGKIIGNICDFTIAALLGTVCVYFLSATGKDHKIVKGGFFGEIAWNFLYGLLARLGLTSVSDTSPKTLLSQCIAHISYGITTACLIDKFGDEGLFNGEVPLSASAVKNQTATKNNESQQ